nr:hypothetical protein [Angustibacter aerolatus]
MVEHVVLVLPERDAAERLADGLRGRGLAVDVHRDALAGDDDAEDAQWLAVVAVPASDEPLVDRAGLEDLAAQFDGWVEPAG